MLVIVFLLRTMALNSTSVCRKYAWLQGVSYLLCIGIIWLGWSYERKTNQNKQGLGLAVTTVLMNQKE